VRNVGRLFESVMMAKYDTGIQEVRCTEGRNGLIDEQEEYSNYLYTSRARLDQLPESLAKAAMELLHFEFPILELS
jgi:hypothetical protein